MSPSFYTLPFLLSLLLFTFPSNSIHFQISSFKPSDTNIVYQGSAAPINGEVDFNINKAYARQVGRAIYAKRVLLWDSKTGQLTDFKTHFTFIIDTNNLTSGDGLAFFLAPFGIEIPPNSSGGFLGLFNTTTMSSTDNQIVHVEFDTFPNGELRETIEHVGINENSIFSSVWTPWNATLHSTETAEIWISYNSTSKNLTVSWKYQTTSNPQEKTSLSYQIDLMKVLPEWVAVGFSAAAGALGERHSLLSWEFNSTLDQSDDDGDDNNSKKKTLVVILTISCGVIVVSVGALVVYALLWRKRKRSKNQKEEAINVTSMNYDLEKGVGPRRFTYKELDLATNNFSSKRKLGQGGFGAVYKGYFFDLDLLVAVKKISKGSRQGKKEYVTEVQVISQLRHRNLVKLLGWCHDKGEFLLVYEFLPNSSLDSHLFGKRTHLPWSSRHKIALGLASSVLYLHEESERCVVHRDIKSSNVMLDSNFNVKLGDFGLAKLMDHEIGPQTTGIAGTLGYLAPEYISTGKASKESDVYSFGVVALEITTGRKAVEIMMDNDGEKGLIEWVWDHYGRGELLVTMDENLKKDFDEKQVECLMIVGLWCAHPDVSLRPSIRQAIQMLNFEVTLPNLPLKRPVATYHSPIPFVSSIGTSITTSLQEGR